ncbi:NAD(P)-dependent oxidoreductase [Sphingobium sp.]|uniref:NAD(P)-dependent oxidoreductase n=1 Tax=Sphingobium sp. TaxID=1912891 RepID=UPI003B3A7FB6
MADERIDQIMNAPPSSSDGMVGMIGVGDMGGAIAQCLLRSVPVMVADLRKDAVDALVAQGARGAASLVELTDSCDVAIIVVVDDRQVTTVVEELLRHPGRLHSIIVSSTILPTTVMALTRKVQDAGIALIDAPVSGGDEKAVRGLLSIMIGGDTAAVERCWPLFEAFGSELFHLGPVGAGSAGKLVNNLLSLGGNMLILEAMQLARAYGITEDSVTEFVTVSAGDSRNIRTWGRHDRSRQHHHLGGTDAIYEIFSKDVKTAALAAGLRGVVLPIAATIGATMGEQLKARDKYLIENDLLGPLPTCRACGQILAKPYRDAGAHPECALGELTAKGMS